MSVACGKLLRVFCRDCCHDRDVDPATVHSLANARASWEWSALQAARLVKFADRFEGEPG